MNSNRQLKSPRGNEKLHRIILLLILSTVGLTDIASASAPWFAKITDTELSILPTGEGVWKGYVEGNGVVQVSLSLFKDGRFYSRYSMGSVALRNRKTWFVYKRLLPQGNGWSWKVSGRAIPANFKRS